MTLPCLSVSHGNMHPGPLQASKLLCIIIIVSANCWIAQSVMNAYHATNGYAEIQSIKETVLLRT